MRSVNRGILVGKLFEYAEATAAETGILRAIAILASEMTHKMSMLRADAVG
ncbi:hypothetical protein [Caballeronia sp. BR00000012568055]|uniref:hypothetical protein n=1 Tax=Caballeronia sp. BR00000012568055 TaxID=2918761 RepID=UPI0023F6DE82|nr:hypothetical protein [Caballeronia sp. BR00000012568055]